MRVHVGSILFEYTGDRATIEGDGRTLSALFDDLERRHPGLKFRVVDEQGALRPHVNVSVNGEWRRDLSTRLSKSDEVHVLAALSGG